MIVCLSGKSGSGKDTIIDLITSMSGYHKHPACTTRPPRRGEVEGIDYWFVNPNQFSEMESRNMFLDHLELSGNHYALPKDGLDDNCIVNLSVNSGLKLKEFCPEAILVFLRLPSKNEQFIRLVSRGMADADILQRLADEHEPNKIAYIYYDLVLFNQTNQQMQTAQHILQYIKEVETGAINTQCRVA